MSEAPSRTLVVILALVCVNGNVVQWETPSNLHPVQGLYVKPSVDGTTGDLYVAASQDSGASAQWVADQPINFLSKPTYSSTGALQEDTIPSQKQPIIAGQTVEITYGGGNPNVVAPYPYPYSPSPVGNPAAYADYAYNYFYPYIMSAAAATAANALKEAGLSEEMANAILSHSTSLWRQPVYSYAPAPASPTQYVTVDPSAWSQGQQAPTTAPAAAVVANQQTTDKPNVLS